MATLRTKITILSLAILGLFTFSGCYVRTLAVGPIRTDSPTIERGAAESVQANITMGVGELTLAGGASSLMNADLTYNIDSWKPEVSYSVTGTQGQLTVKQPDTKSSGIPTGNVRYEWNVRLNSDVPTDLRVTLGAGEANLNLRDVAVRTLSLTGGASNSRVMLPAKSLTNLQITSGTGNLILDLTGDWKQNLNAMIQGGVGSITLRLPRSSGVRVNVQGGVGSVSAPGFSSSRGDYVNAAVESSSVTLQITIRSGVGSVNLEQVD